MSPRNKLALTLLGGLALGLAAVGPAVGQQSPESLLPPGFGAAPPPAPAMPGDPAVAPAPENAAAPAAVPDTLVPLDEAGNSAEAAPEAPPPPPELPPGARRSLALVGSTDIYGENAFGDLDGRYLATLMRRIQTPIASRWAEIVLRRALLSRTPAPVGESQPDWVADRAALLLRLGEANGARQLVQGVDVDMFNARLRRVAMQSAFASADPAALCPLSDGSETVGSQPIWPMVRAFCAAFSNDAATANATIGRSPPNDQIDHPLAEKLVAAGGGRRVMPVDWTAVDTLTDWRFGLASALNIVIPQPLLDAAPVWFKAWLAQAPMLTAADRIAPARVSAALGVTSAAELVDLYGRVMDEAGDIDTDSPAGRLRAAYVGDDDEAKVTAMHALWDANGDAGERDRYASAILTARAAAGLTPSGDRVDDLPSILGALFAAGLDEQAERWADVAQKSKGEDGDRVWAILSVGAVQPRLGIDARRLESFAKRAGSIDAHRTAMLAAALAGLGRLPLADAQQVATDAGLPIGAESLYGRALDRAVRGSSRGGVALLVATGMQNASWHGVPPADFYSMMRALRAVGMENEARMIAAEAMTRL
jgi:hypothetical protein